MHLLIAVPKPLERREHRAVSSLPTNLMKLACVVGEFVRSSDVAVVDTLNARPGAGSRCEGDSAALGRSASRDGSRLPPMPVAQPASSTNANGIVRTNPSRDERHVRFLICRSSACQAATTLKLVPVLRRSLELSASIAVHAPW